MSSQPSNIQMIALIWGFSCLNHLGPAICIKFKWVILNACTCITTTPYHDDSWTFKSNINLCLLLKYASLSKIKWSCRFYWPWYHQIEYTFIKLIVESGIVQQFLWIKMSKILTELLFKVYYIPWCEWFLLLFNTHMINFGTKNTCKDAANLVLHVARLKAQHYVRKSCTKTKIPPNSRKLHADFTLIFWKTEKIATYLISLDVWCLVRKILALKHTQLHRFHV